MGGLQREAGEARRTKEGALMHVWAESLEALLVVGGGGSTSLRSATAFMESVDPPTCGVPMTQVRLPPGLSSPPPCSA